MPPTLGSLESSLASTETFVRWVALLAALCTGLTAIGGVRLWLLQRAAKPLREQARRLSEERLAALQSQIAQANARAAEAQEKAEGERLARVKIEQRLAPRLLMAHQRESISAKMSAWAKLPGTDERQEVAVFAIGTSFEAARLADQVADALKAAGWNINRYPVMFGKSYSVAGIGLLTSSNQRGISVAGELAKALNAEGVFTFLIPERRSGCEEDLALLSKSDKDPYCSQISVVVGDHP